ncbi:MAG: ATPase, partial [Planctomyces sp.]|nr:ATPase [Planctomyces sp.]
MDALQDPEPCHIVGIGASAGGLEALEKLFDNLDSNTGLAFIVVQHLSPDFKSHMDELLARRTNMPIQMVENGMQTEPDNVYLIPPNKEMVISGRKLLLTDRNAQKTPNHPIDQFLRSLASDVGPYSIAVILSGTGSDGSRGIRDIHDVGGLVLCQDENSASFDGMPINAIATGIVDKILPPAQIAEAIMQHVRHIPAPDEDAPPEAAGDSDELASILELIRHRLNVDFKRYKLNTIERRITRRATLSNIDSLNEYHQVLQNNNEELNHLLSDLLIGVTRFFRDEEAFECLQDELSALIKRKAEEKSPLRIWVAGCATGEEAFSIAMLADQEMQRLRLEVDLQIFATDASNDALQKAGRGSYTQKEVYNLPDQYLGEYFNKEGDHYQISKDLRNMVVFAPHNLLTDPPFTQMDLVTCRNLLIYLTPNAQKKVLSLLHFSLRREGILFLGPSETPYDLIDEFEPVSKRWRIYRKHRDGQLPLTSRLPFQMPSQRLTASTRTGLPHSNSPVSDRSRMGIYENLLNLKMPPSILVSNTYETLHVFEGAEKFLRVA